MITSDEKLIALKMYPNGDIEKIELPPAKYKFKRMQLAVSDDCSVIDIKDMYEALELEDYCLVFDDEFLLKETIIINPIASYMYGYQQHGQPLCGNVLIMKNSFVPDTGLETIGLSNEDITVIHNFVVKSYHKILAAYNEFIAKIRSR